MTTRYVPNRFFYELGISGNNFLTNSYKVALVGTGFTFDLATHGTYADISDSEIAADNGYVTGGFAVDVETAWAQDDVNDQAKITFADVVLTATGGDYPVFSAAIIYNDTHASKIIVGCVEIGVDVLITDGNSFQLQQLSFKLSMPAGV